MADFISGFGKLCGCLLAGQLLKKSELCNNLDAEIGFKFVQIICLPCLVIQVMKQVTVQSLVQSLPMLIVPTMLSFVSAAASLLFFKNRYNRERALVVGFCSSVEPTLLAYPIVYSIFGIQGLLYAITYMVGQLCCGNFIAFLALRSGGTVFPSKYVHDDGGVYSGEWKGRMKNGVGRYKYPNGAVYEGQWFENQKQGYGVYKYANGGQYRGQWFGNSPQGIGVRIFSNGKVKQGLWQNGKMIQPLLHNECYSFADAAQTSANAVKQMKLGMPELQDGILSSLLQPQAIAYIAMAALIVCNIPLPSLVSAISETLAIVGVPLGLIALTLCQPDLVESSVQSNKDIMVALGIKFGIPIAFGLLITTLIQAGLLPQVFAICGVVAMICGIGPIQATHLQMAEEYRLNGLLMQNLYSISIYASAIISAVLALSMWMGNLDALSAILDGVSFQPLLYACIALCIGGGSAVAYGSLSTKRTIPMVYVGKSYNKASQGKIVSQINCYGSAKNKLDKRRENFKMNHHQVSTSYQRQKVCLRQLQNNGRCLQVRKLFV